MSNPKPQIMEGPHHYQVGVGTRVYIQHTRAFTVFGVGENNENVHIYGPHDETQRLMHFQSKHEWIYIKCAQKADWMLTLYTQEDGKEKISKESATVIIQDNRKSTDDRLRELIYQDKMMARRMAMDSEPDDEYDLDVDEADPLTAYEATDMAIDHLEQRAAEEAEDELQRKRSGDSHVQGPGQENRGTDNQGADASESPGKSTGEGGSQGESTA